MEQQGTAPPILSLALSLHSSGSVVQSALRGVRDSPSYSYFIYSVGEVKMSVHNAEHLANDYDNLYGSGEIVGDAYDDNAYNSANENIYWSGNNATSVDDAVGANYSSSGEIKQRGGRYNTFSTRKSMDDSVLGDARMSRIAMTEAAIRREMFKDCTFTPNIKNLPSSYGAMKDLGSNFQTRVAKWQRDKEAEKQKKIAASSQAELTDCTFHPRISRNSEKAVKEIRGEAEEDANERLYKSSNLYAEHRMRQIELERQKQEEKDRLECSFQPKLATQKDLYQVNARFHLTASQKNPHETQKDPKLKECTFTPKVIL